MTGASQPEVPATTTATNRSMSTETGGQLTTPENVRISSHADLRWVQRTREFACRPRTGWQRAVPVTYDDGEFDRVRYDPETDTLLCVNDGELTTVLQAKYETFDVREQRPATTAQSRCVACGTARAETTGPCPDCGTRPVVRPHLTTTTPEGR